MKNFKPELMKIHAAIQGEIAQHSKDALDGTRRADDEDDAEIVSEGRWACQHIEGAIDCIENIEERLESIKTRRRVS